MCVSILYFFVLGFFLLSVELLFVARLFRRRRVWTVSTRNETTPKKKNEILNYFVVCSPFGNGLRGHSVLFAVRVYFAV